MKPAPNDARLPTGDILSNTVAMPQPIANAVPQAESPSANVKRRFQTRLHQVSAFKHLCMRGVSIIAATFCSACWSTAAKIASSPTFPWPKYPLIQALIVKLCQGGTNVGHRLSSVYAKPEVSVNTQLMPHRSPAIAAIPVAKAA